MNECAECSDNMVSEEGADSCTTCEAGKGPNSDQSACGKYFCWYYDNFIIVVNRVGT